MEECLVNVMQLNVKNNIIDYNRAFFICTHVYAIK